MARRSSFGFGSISGSDSAVLAAQLDSGELTVDSTVGRDQKSLLYDAIESDDILKVSLLVNRNVDVNYGGEVCSVFVCLLLLVFYFFIFICFSFSSSFLVVYVCVSVCVFFLKKRALKLLFSR